MPGEEKDREASGELSHGNAPVNPASTARLGGQSRTKLHLAILIALWAIVYLPGLPSPPLMDDADSQHAEAVREMITRGDYVTLHANGVRYMLYAPFPYWITAGSFRLFGVSEWSARLPLALCVLALLVVLYLFGKRFLDEEAGVWAAVIMATALGPYIFTRFLIPDVIVGLWLAVGLYLFLAGLEQPAPTRRVCWGLGASVALSVLTKGLIGLVFPAAAIGFYLLLTANLRHLARMRLLSSTAVFLAIAAPWHVLAALRNPAQGQVKGFLWFYFINEHFLRYLGKRIPHDYGKVPLLLFWGLLLVWLLPWSAFLPKSMGQVPLSLRDWRQTLETRVRANLLFLVWALVVLVFFSFSTRQEYYVIPAVPALALLMGGWLARESASDEHTELRRAGKKASAVLLPIGFIALVAAVSLTALSHTPPPGADLAQLLKKNPDMYVLSLGHFFDLTGEAMGMFRGPLMTTGLALFLGTGLNWLYRRRGSPRKGNLALALMMCVVLFCVHLALGVFSPVLGSKPLAMAIKERYLPGEILVSDGEYSTTSSINFYTGIQMYILNGRVNDLWYGSLFPDSPPIFLDDESFGRMWKGPSRVYLVTPDENRLTALAAMGGAYELARAGGKFVLTNRPLEHVAGP